MTVTRGPVAGGPVRMALIGTGDMGSGHLKQIIKEFVDLRALCDINPKRRQSASDLLVNRGWAKPQEYDDWRDMLEKEDLEAVLIATPLWTHADIAVGCLDAGKHVLCEKMMAKSEADCHRMIEAARRNRRVLEIGYQRYYNPMYQAAYESIIKQGVLGEVYHARLAWHRNSTWRKNEEPPSTHFDPSKWGYPDWEHLLNWRMYKKYSEGLIAELGSHQVTATSWFFDASPEAVYTAGGVARFKDGREVFDHIYSTFEYPGGRTVTYSSVESCAFENRYEMYFGTKATLVMRNEVEAMLFDGGESERESCVQVTPRESAAAADASETRPGNTAAGAASAASSPAVDRTRPSATRQEISRFCAAVRVHTPLACGPQQAMYSARACIRANEAIARKSRLDV